jgi:general secretion pathway protein C
MNLLKITRYSVLVLGIVGSAAAAAYWLPKLLKPTDRIPQALPPQSLAPDVTNAATLFGSVKPSEVAAPTLNIQVVGLISTASEHGSVVLAVEGKAAKAYRVGDAVYGQGTVKAIRAHEVVITINGQDQTFAAPQQASTQPLSSTHQSLSLAELAPNGVLGNENAVAVANSSQQPGVMPIQHPEAPPSNGSLQMAPPPNADPNMNGGFVSQPPSEIPPNAPPNQPAGTPGLLPVPTTPNPPQQLVPPSIPPAIQ